MKRVTGDLIALAREGRFDVIVHGCNCFCDMGAGIAKAIAAACPQALAADQATAKGDRSKLGTISTAEVREGDRNLIVVNAYTQFHWKGRGRLADYDAIESCFEEVAGRFPTARIGYPAIGAGMARGEWEVIAPRIDRALRGLDHALVVLPR